MGKMYTFDNKLLTETPEIRIGDTCYPIDDRAPTVKKLLKQLNSMGKDDDSVIDTDEIIIKAAFNKNAEKILELDLSYNARQILAKMALAAMTGEEYTEDEDDRFPEEKSE